MDANAWSALQAQKQMNFQERMSNTSYQRAVSDLKKAGLNPVLAAGNGGASTPSGAIGQTFADDAGGFNSAGALRGLVREVNQGNQDTIKAVGQLLHNGRVDRTGRDLSLATSELVDYNMKQNQAAALAKQQAPSITKALLTLGIAPYTKGLGALPVVSRSLDPIFQAVGDLAAERIMNGDYLNSSSGMAMQRNYLESKGVLPKKESTAIGNLIYNEIKKALNSSPTVAKIKAQISKANASMK